MMDFGYLLRILARLKWLIIGAMAVAALATYMFIGLRPEKYKVSVIMATGIVNYKGINSDNSDQAISKNGNKCIIDQGNDYNRLNTGTHITF